MSHITVILQNDIFFWKNKTFLWCMILQNAFLTPEQFHSVPAFLQGV